jgi:hypothetical protein
VTAKLGGPARFDRRHHLELTKAEVTGLRLPVRRSVGPEYIGDL